MSSDVTYLEAFLESLTTLPQEVRRNMELLKDLDKACNTDLHQLRQIQRSYILAAEEKLLQLEVVEMEESDDDEEDEDDDDDEDGENDGTKDSRMSNNNEGRTTIKYGIRALNEDGTTSPDNPVVIPTTAELMEYTYDAEKYKMITKLENACIQRADEKCAVAQQAYELIDAKIQRLDNDLQAMEKLLHSTGEIQALSGNIAAGKPDDLAACQITPGSEWILAKVILHDPITGMYKLADEDIESNKIFDLPDQQVIVLSGLIDRLSKGDVVFAVYPDTTSFYQATVVQAPRKQGVRGQYVMVNFVDDSDEFGITHDKAVPIEHVMPPPPIT